MSNPIALLIADKAQSLALSLVPKIISVANQAGIKNLGTLKEELPNTCQPKKELEKILKVRNQIINQLNSTSKVIELLSKPLDVFTPALNTIETSLNIAKTTVNTVTIAISAVPPSLPVPAQLITGLVKANKLVDITLPPIITTTSNKITSITKAVDFVNNILLQLMNLLGSIDTYLLGCDTDGLTPLNDGLTPLNDYLQNLKDIKNTIPNDNIYNNFILEIVEEPFSPTVNRRKAVAKNSQGIILLQTPLSFTTNNQTLINQIKLLIDSNNLKAD